MSNFQYFIFFRLVGKSASPCVLQDLREFSRNFRKAF